MRWIPVAALLLVSVASAADKAQPYLQRGEVLYKESLAVIEKADAARRPAQRHLLLGRARQTAQRASDQAMAACRVMTPGNRATVMSFQRRVEALMAKISAGRKAYRSTTDISAQKVFKFKPNVAMVRQTSRLVELQKSRHAAKQTRANMARITRRDQLNQWRLARVAARLRNARR